MQRSHLSSKKGAVNMALRLRASEVMSADDVRAPRGTGWEGDRDTLHGIGSRDSHLVILIDSSAWIEFLRDIRSPTCERGDQIVEADVASCEPIRMEILAGARDEAHLTNLRGLLDCITLIATQPVDHETAAVLYRACRRNGETLRTLADCLMAAIAVRADATFLHANPDFDVISRHSTLIIESRSGRN